MALNSGCASLWFPSFLALTPPIVAPNVAPHRPRQECDPSGSAGVHTSPEISWGAGFATQLLSDRGTNEHSPTTGRLKAVTEVGLVPFAPEHLATLEPWFDDPETRLRLGDRSWIRRALRLLADPPEGEFRGKNVTGRHMWVSLDQSGALVGYVDGETYDRYAKWDGEGPEGAIISDLVPVPSMGLTWVIDPKKRKQGFCVATIRAVLAHPDLLRIRLFFAEIDSDHVASARCAERAGFTRRYAEPDFERMLHFTLER